MVLVTYKKHGVRLTHVWFATETECQLLEQKAKDTDVLFIHGANFVDKVGRVMVFPQISLIKHFSGSEEEVWSSFGKHLKAYIKRSYRVGAKIQVYTAEQINAEVLDLCANLYEQMKISKGIPDKFNYSLAECYKMENALFIVMAYVNDKPVGFNAYIADQYHFRTWLTAFAFREEEFDAQVVSRAHQLLEWETMRWCCQNGITSYDFGGISSFENPNGIDKFKMTFAKEGQRVSYDNYLVGVSLLGKFIVLGYKILKKLRK